MDAKNKGFTLVELIIGIVVLSIALVLIVSLVIPQARKSVDPIMQVRATELAQSLLNEITAKSFDENSDRVNGVIRCNENYTDSAGNPQFIECTEFDDLGAEETNRQNFDDVDDYNGLNQSSGAITNSLGGALEIGGVNLYQGFTAQVTVFYDGNYDGVNDNAQADAKLITVTITTPSQDELVFSAYRSNF